jgi:hypothetical protein
MQIFRGIPDDTPENMAHAIEAILQEESTQLGATSRREVKRQGLAIILTIDVTLNSKHFGLLLSYLESFNLQHHGVSGSIGTGFIFAGPDHWDLELLSRDWLRAPSAPPFRWALYPHGRKDLEIPPFHILDSALLRGLLHQSLSSLPSASP